MLKRFFAPVTFLFVLALSGAGWCSNGYEEALAAYKKGDFGRAAAMLKEHVAKSPSAEAYYLLGYSHYKMKDFGEARKYFDEAYLIDPRLEPEKIIESEADKK